MRSVLGTVMHAVMGASERPELGLHPRVGTQQDVERARVISAALERGESPGEALAEQAAKVRAQLRRAIGAWVPR